MNAFRGVAWWFWFLVSRSSPAHQTCQISRETHPRYHFDPAVYLFTFTDMLFTPKTSIITKWVDWPHIGGSTCPCSVVMIVCGHQDHHMAPPDGREALISSLHIFTPHRTWKTLRLMSCRASNGHLSDSLHAVWWSYRGCLTTPQLSWYHTVVEQPLKRSGHTIMRRHRARKTVTSSLRSPSTA